MLKLKGEKKSRVGIGKEVNYNKLITKKCHKLCCNRISVSRCDFLPGKVYVSHIVDYLRHTTSRSSEDSGLEELCNMLDPEHKDVSIDLDTYHAVMREWIDDCRNNGY